MKATVDSISLVTGIALGSVTITTALDGINKVTSAITIIPPHIFTVHSRDHKIGEQELIYWSNTQQAGSLLSPLGSVSMTENGDNRYSYTVNNITSATVISNHGTNQSTDFARSTSGWYLNGVWHDTKPETLPLTGQLVTQLLLNKRRPLILN